MVPSYLFRNELAVTFQGFNAWHSFQYLGLTFLALNRADSAGKVTVGFVEAARLARAVLPLLRLERPPDVRARARSSSP